MARNVRWNDFTPPGLMFIAIVVMGQVWAPVTHSNSQKLFLLTVIDASWFAGVAIWYAGVVELFQQILFPEDEQKN